MIKSYWHTGIVVSNLKKSEKFYNKLLNLKKVSRMIESGDYSNRLTGMNFKADILKVKSDDNVIVEIIQLLNIKKKKVKKPKSMFDLGIIHMCFTVPNIEKLYKRLKKIRSNFFHHP